jgi:Protein of unknown function (DUF3768)
MSQPMQHQHNHEAVNATISAVPELKARRIRELNDRFRTSGIGLTPAHGRKVLTAGVEALGQTEVIAIALKVVTFKDFTDRNDPHDEHDFGLFEHNGQAIYWKIDYTTPDLKHASPDPSDPNVTCRVLTIMLASEY